MNVWFAMFHVEDTALSAKILHKSLRGPNILYKLELPSQEECLAVVSSHHNHRIGEQIGIQAEVDHLIVFGN